MTAKLQSLSATSLAELLKIGRTQAAVWSPADLAELLQQLLTLPLDRAFPCGIGEDPGSAVQHRADATSLRTLLQAPQPSLDLLVAVKECVNRGNESPEQALPREVATAIYFACIARALVASDQFITSLDGAQLHKGLRWVQAQPWVDAAIKESAAEALSRLDEPSSGGGIDTL
jgi:hypothetical protein